jgi:tRNA(adenine34) deaminase
MTSPFGSERDTYYMQQALAQARKAAVCDEVPVGALVVDAEGAILAQAYNTVEKSMTQTAHAELLASRKASKRLGDWRLLGCWLYVTLEPCSMCMNFILLSRFEGVVFGAASPLFGYSLDKDAIVSLYKGDALRIVSGVCAQDSAHLLRTFFHQKRNKSG